MALQPPLWQQIKARCKCWASFIRKHMLWILTIGSVQQLSMSNSWLKIVHFKMLKGRFLCSGIFFFFSNCSQWSQMQGSEVSFMCYIPWRGNYRLAIHLPKFSPKKWEWFMRVFQAMIWYVSLQIPPVYWLFHIHGEGSIILYVYTWCRDVISSQQLVWSVSVLVGFKLIFFLFKLMAPK